MLSDTDRDALEDIRDNIVRVTRFVHGLDFVAFLEDNVTAQVGQPIFHGRT